MSRAPRQGMPRRRRPKGAAVSPSRSAALNAALLAAKRGIPLDSALDEVLAAGEVSLRDRRLAEEITYGAVRHRGSIDMVLAEVSSRPVRDIQAAALEAMRQAIYQTFYLERVPEHAAVGEAVQLARNLSGAKIAGFTNAVLRSALHLRRGRGRRAGSGDRSRSALSFRTGELITLTTEMLPDPEENLAAWLAGHYSYPPWLVQRLLDEQGLEKTEQILVWGNEIPHLWARVNCMRSGDAALGKGSGAELCMPGKIFSGCSSVTEGDFPGAYRIVPERGIASLPGIKQGLFSIQDETQQRVAVRLSPQAGEKVLDLCAAPGGKSMHLAELSANGAEVLACDADASRLIRVEESARRLGITCVSTRELAVPPLPSKLAGQFDAVLADVPCSNTGSMNRRVESRWRASQAATDKLTALQFGILRAAADAVRPGGRLVYATCSLLGAENAAPVRAFLASSGGGRMIDEELTLPRAGVRDGGYVAVLEL